MAVAVSAGQQDGKPIVQFLKLPSKIFVAVDSLVIFLACTLF